MELMSMIRRLTYSVFVQFLIYVFLVSGVACDTQFTAMYVFGDSLIDNGNNNYINALARSNYLPYGVDFFRGPTGRFTNGKTVIDFLCELIGLPYIPPFANPFANDRDILYGVNYASGAGGIMEQSGEALGERFSFNKQIENFVVTKKQLQNQLTDVDLQQYLAKALVVLIQGSNDYINNYLIPSYGTASKYKPEAFADLLISEFTKQVTALYDQGLRNFFLAGIGAIGCSPAQRDAGKIPSGKCNDFSNDVAQMFNTRLSTLADQLNTTREDATFIFGNTFDALMEIINNPTKYGITVVEQSCCGGPSNKTCYPLSFPCLNRDQHVWWDAYHPTQIVHRYLAMSAYGGSNSFAYPIKEMARI